MKKLILVFMVALFPAVCGASGFSMTWISGLDFLNTANHRKATRQTLLLLLHNPDPVEVSLGIRGTRVASRKYQKRIALPVYRAIWRNDAHVYPSLDFTYLRQPMIMLAVAGALADITQEHKPEYREYVLQQIHTKDPKLLRVALIALGSVGKTSDIKLLSEIAKQDDGEYLYNCISSMLEINYDVAKPEVLKLKKYFGPYSRQAKMIDGKIYY